MMEIPRINAPCCKPICWYVLFEDKVQRLLYALSSCHLALACARDSVIHDRVAFV
eukprot:COSAG02_NODE_5039_length_4703_cov_4.134014_2_plen_55_part_00